ncbi:MAG: hypothetical protein IT531_15355 [Burkholderiales bacterium]|nr:hypothetical protein [Burkholderiales bacterium]
MNASLRLSRRGFLLGTLAWAAGSAAAQCRRTPTDALGPYYLAAQPQQRDLCQRDTSPGMLVSGFVRRFPECQPVPGALVEVWHADARGAYSRTDTVVASDLACMLRASVRAGDDGRYAFRTLAPGAYFRRAAHIHFRVSAPGFRTLVTQMYFPPQEGIDARLLARSLDTTALGPGRFEFDLNIAPE